MTNEEAAEIFRQVIAGGKPAYEMVFEAAKLVRTFPRSYEYDFLGFVVSYLDNGQEVKAIIVSDPLRGATIFYLPTGEVRRGGIYSPFEAQPWPTIVN